MRADILHFGPDPAAKNEQNLDPALEMHRIGIPIHYPTQELMFL
jgi:hypothetical protein